MRTLLWIIGGCLLLGACGEGPTATPPPNLSGVYDYSLRMSRTPGATCVSTGRMALRESGGQLTGEANATGECTSSGGTWQISSRNLLAGTVRRESGATLVEFSLGGCPYQGRQTRAAPNIRLSGSMTCTINGFSQGTWSAEQ